MIKFAIKSRRRGGGGVTTVRATVALKADEWVRRILCVIFLALSGNHQAVLGQENPLIELSEFSNPPLPVIT